MIEVTQAVQAVLATAVTEEPKIDIGFALHALIAIVWALALGEAASVLWDFGKLFAVLWVCKKLHTHLAKKKGDVK